MERDHPLRTGDRIRLGDTEIVFETAEHNTDRMLAVADTSPSMTISIPVNEIDSRGARSDTGDSRQLKTLNLLARELIEDRPTEELFGFIVDRVLRAHRPSRAALGLLGAGRQVVRQRRSAASGSRPTRPSFASAIRC